MINNYNITIIWQLYNNYNNDKSNDLQENKKKTEYLKFAH